MLLALPLRRRSDDRVMANVELDSSGGPSESLVRAPVSRLRRASAVRCDVQAHAERDEQPACAVDPARDRPRDHVAERRPGQEDQSEQGPRPRVERDVDLRRRSTRRRGRHGARGRAGAGRGNTCAILLAEARGRGRRVRKNPSASPVRSGSAALDNEPPFPELVPHAQLQERDDSPRLWIGTLPTLCRREKNGWR